MKKPTTVQEVKDLIAQRHMDDLLNAISADMEANKKRRRQYEALKAAADRDYQIKAYHDFFCKIGYAPR